jgi:hypothetical protein
MRAYSNMPIRAFIDQIRTIAQNAGANGLVMDKFDELELLPTLEEAEAEKEKLATEKYDEGHSDGRDSQWEICYDMLADKLEDLVSPDERVAILELMKEINPQ